jgi:hypothetical protein
MSICPIVHLIRNKFTLSSSSETEQSDSDNPQHPIILVASAATHFQMLRIRSNLSVHCIGQFDSELDCVVGEEGSSTLARKSGRISDFK